LGIGVGVKVGVGVGVGVWVGVGVGVGVRVGVGVFVGVCVATGVFVGVGVMVEVPVAVDVPGAGVPNVPSTTEPVEIVGWVLTVETKVAVTASGPELVRSRHVPFWTGNVAAEGGTAGPPTMKKVKVPYS